VGSVVTDAGEYALHVATGKRVEFDHVRTGRGVMTFRAERPLSALECTLIESTVGPLCIINRRDVYTSEVRL
jgi:hypothetical protein